jgi:hypothetical protein
VPGGHGKQALQLPVMGIMPAHAECYVRTALRYYESGGEDGNAHEPGVWGLVEE